MREKVVILGGGISGLAAAWFLEKKGVTDIVLLEGTEKVGGKINTLNEDGFLVETAADSFITTKPEALELVRELGMEEEIIEPETNRFFIYKDGHLLDSPKGLRMLAGVDEKVFRTSRLFSEEGNDRILNERNIPPRMDDGDESFASFITRRFGEEMLHNYAEPLFGGIYATPSNEMSMQATFPMFLALEKKYGSLTAAAEVTQTAGGNRSAFVGLKYGMGSLVERLAKSLRHTRIQFNSHVNSLEKTENAHRVHLENGEALTCAAVVSALPAKALAGLLEDINREAAGFLKQFTVSSSQIITLAYKRADVKGDMEATGFVSAKGEKNLLSASTWTSSKWKGRAPEEYFLVRCFLRGEVKQTAEAIRQAHTALKELLYITGEPAKNWVHTWSNALPQYKVGHLDRVLALNEALAHMSGFGITGAYLGGVGIPDCIRQAKEAIEKLSTQVTAL
jgi:oxygen-dependent protoporphyrinogen oxidase